MQPGVQWTELWFRGNELVKYDTHKWGDNDGEATGGIGSAEWSPQPEMWQAGLYEVQIFVGHEWKVVGQFIVTGDPFTPTPSITTSETAMPSATPLP